MRAIARWYLAVVAVLCAGGTALPGGGGSIDLAWLAKTREGTKAVYENYKALCSRLEEESEFRTDKVPGSAGTMPFETHTEHQRIVRLGDNVIWERVRILDANPKKPLIRLDCDNNDYHFTLSKSREDAPYALIEYALGKRKIPLIQQEPGLHNEGFSLLRNILAAIENDGELTLHKLQFDNTKRLLLVEYRVGTSAQNQISIDPSHDWRVVERRVETPNVVSTMKWSYGVRVSGLEFPIGYKSLTTFNVAKAPPNFETTGRIIHLKITDKAPEDFRLSAFDLPEPIDAPPLPEPTPWYLWILAAAIASAALAMSFAWLKRRHTKTNTLSSKAS